MTGDNDVSSDDREKWIKKMDELHRATPLYNKRFQLNPFNYEGFKGITNAPLKNNVAMRHNEDKVPLVFILDFPNAIEGLAKIKEHGATKYALHNWKKGRPFRDTISSLLRHLVKFQNGEYLDTESNLPHIDHVVWNALALAEWCRTHPELNDCVNIPSSKEVHKQEIDPPEKMEERDWASLIQAVNELNKYQRDRLNIGQNNEIPGP